MKLLLPVFCFLILTSASYAQQFGGLRPSVRFKQINAGGVRVIFPEGYDSAGRRVAAVVTGLKGSTLPSIGETERPVSIVLQPNTTIPNAYVTMGPFRSELFLIPPQNSFDLGSVSWIDMLAVHEYRHVQQYNNFNVGLSRAFRILFGQQGQALANAVAVPNWFWEGDAVFQETLVSNQGRGRIPYFFNDYRAIWADKRNYSYMKLRNGSYRHFVPDHYRLGYMLVAHGRNKYGPDFWRGVTRDAASFKGLFYPLQRGIRKHAKVSFTQFRREAMEEFQKQLYEDIATSVIPGLHTPILPAPEQVVSHKSTGAPYADEEFPAFTDNANELVFVRSGYKKIPSFIKRNYNGGIIKESVIRVRDVSLDNHFSLKNGKIVYASRRQHPRWGWTDYNEIQILDTESGRQKTLTHRSRYFAPDISEDNHIIAVDVRPGGRSFLHLLDARTGMLIKELPNHENLFYTYPKFINSQHVVSAVRTPSGMMALVDIDLSSGQTEYITPPAMRTIAFPAISGDTVYFSASDDRAEKIFALSLKDEKLFRIRIANLCDGLYQPTVRADTVFVTTFTADGFKLKVLMTDPALFEPIGATEWARPLSDFGVALTGEKGSAVLGTVADQIETNVKAYPKLHRPFNFHSSRPLVDDPIYSFSVLGENVLNTVQSELFFNYNRTEQYKQLGFKTRYGGLFPMISAGANYTFDRRARFRNTRIFFDELQLRGGLNVPLNLSKGRSYTNLNVGSDFVYTQPNFKGLYKDTLGDRDYSSLNNYISFSHQIQQARQHIFPRFAQTLLLNYRKGIARYKGNQFLASGNLYFPGMAQTHNLVFNVAFQGRDSSNINNFSNGFPFSRGYTAENLFRMYKAGANYHLPVAYPDWGFGNLVYLMRIRANVFYDFTRVQDYNTARQLVNVDLRSTGVEIFLDTKWWNELPVNFGIRYSRLLDRDLFGDHGPNWFEFVLPVNLVN